MRRALHVVRIWLCADDVRARWTSILHPRSGLLAKASAIWLVVLILLPFTAPFPTYELPNSDHSPVQVKDKSGSDDMLVTPLLRVLPDSTPDVIHDVTGLSGTVVDEQLPRYQVLRL